MKFGELVESRLLNSIPSIFVLPVARAIYLFIALVSLLTVVGGILYVIYLQISAAGQPRKVPVPPPYQGSLAVPTIPPGNFDLELVQARLNPPTNIRFVVTAETVSTPLKQGTVLGFFTADTPNRIAAYPESVSILGGPDADRFVRVLHEKSRAAGLAVTPMLATEIEELLRDIKGEKERTFQIRVVMRDQFGTTSPAEDISFSLRLAPAPVVDPEPKTEPQVELTEIEKIAREVANIIEPTVNPAHFSAYNKAMQAPRQCRASDSDQVFLANYRRAVEDVRSKLTSRNVEAFYAGLCDAWKQVLQKRADAEEQAERLVRAARNQAEQARENALAQNRDLQIHHAEQVFRAKAYTTVTLFVIGGALGIFLSISLILAFLAIEGHSRAVRLAIENIVKVPEQGKFVDTSGSNPS